ncbi:hypothetical protein CP8484711_1662B, partial [Chlamydia psittaci 84-8471/1]
TYHLNMQLTKQKACYTT